MLVGVSRGTDKIYADWLRQQHFVEDRQQQRKSNMHLKIQKLI